MSAPSVVRRGIGHFLPALRMPYGVRLRLAATANALVALLGWIWRYRAELLVAIGVLAGWYALTWVIADIIGHATRVWLVAIALLAFSLVGWRWLGALAMTGLYIATRPTKAEKTPRG